MVTPSGGGAVVLVRFPFSALSQPKQRPAVVLADAGRGDWILCQITNSAYSDPRALFLTDRDFASGSLRVGSYARPGKRFTESENLMTWQVGIPKAQAFQRIVEVVVALLQPSAPSPPNP